MTHRVHVWFIYLHMVDFLVNVGKYTSAMDPVGDGGGFWRSSEKNTLHFTWESGPGP